MPIRHFRQSSGPRIEWERLPCYDGGRENPDRERIARRRRKSSGSSFEGVGFETRKSFSSLDGRRDRRGLGRNVALGARSRGGGGAGGNTADLFLRRGRRPGDAARDARGRLAP